MNTRRPSLAPTPDSPRHRHMKSRMVIPNLIVRIEVESTSAALKPLEMVRPCMRTRRLRLALAVGVGLAAWWFYLEYALPVVQWVNGQYPQAFQIAAVVLSVSALGLALESRRAKGRQNSAP